MEVGRVFPDPEFASAPGYIAAQGAVTALGLVYLPRSTGGPRVEAVGAAQEKLLA